MTRLAADTLATVPMSVKRPTYDRKKNGVGIVHLGLGAFHKAHQAFYTDAAMSLHGGDWNIIAVSMRNAQTANEFNDQDGLYTLIVKGAGVTEAHIIGSIAQALCANTQPEAVLDALCDPRVRIVTTTITEKGYGIDRATGGVDPNQPVMAQDLRHAAPPKGAIGLIVAALAQRRANGTPPFTVLCCDNLPDNGAFLRAGLIDFARRCDAELGGWIADTVACPSTMVDRITPAQTLATRALARDMTGTEDALTVETERFHQWVIEDHFPTGRPAWEAAGAIFTKDVAPFEKMKLRLLNGSHSLIAYMGTLLDRTYVRDVMADPQLAAIVSQHLEAAATTLPPMPDIDLPAYCADLIARFRNPDIAHETFQIATDGSEKMPQRIFSPAVDAIAAGQPVRPYAFATALWIWHCRGDSGRNKGQGLNDPRADLLRTAAHLGTPEAILAQFEKVPGLFPEKLKSSELWRREILSLLTDLMTRSPEQVILSESRTV